ncbi:MAG: hypothetical protein R3C68_09055 [Myxococcota bacterium]
MSSPSKELPPLRCVKHQLYAIIRPGIGDIRGHSLQACVRTCGDVQRRVVPKQAIRTRTAGFISNRQVRRLLRTPRSPSITSAGPTRCTS